MFVMQLSTCKYIANSRLPQEKSMLSKSIDYLMDAMTKVQASISK